MEIREIEIARIGGSLCRMRLERDYERDELLASIRECGVMEPIKVKKVGDGYLNFTGHRRLDCAKELGMVRIRAEVWDDISDGEAGPDGVRGEHQPERFCSDPASKPPSPATGLRLRGC